MINRGSRAARISPKPATIRAAPGFPLQSFLPPFLPGRPGSDECRFNSTGAQKRISAAIPGAGANAAGKHGRRIQADPDSGGNGHS
jgi:hypothetical protein